MVWNWLLKVQNTRPRMIRRWKVNSYFNYFNVSILILWGYIYINIDRLLIMCTGYMGFVYIHSYLQGYLVLYMSVYIYICMSELQIFVLLIWNHENHCLSLFGITFFESYIRGGTCFPYFWNAGQNSVMTALDLINGTINTTDFAPDNQIYLQMYCTSLPLLPVPLAYPSSEQNVSCCSLEKQNAL